MQIGMMMYFHYVIGNFVFEMLCGINPDNF